MVATGPFSIKKCLTIFHLTLFAGTLALGINAPTKTSVFCGDSPYLTALMVRLFYNLGSLSTFI
jgi:hypothetical protein